MPGQHRAVRRLDDEGRRRQVALADPQLHHLRVVAPAIRHEADLARADAADPGRQRGGEIDGGGATRVSAMGAGGSRGVWHAAGAPRGAVARRGPCLPGPGPLGMAATLPRSAPHVQARRIPRTPRATVARRSRTADVFSTFQKFLKLLYRESRPLGRRPDRARQSRSADPRPRAVRVHGRVPHRVPGLLDRAGELPRRAGRPLARHGPPGLHGPVQVLD